MVAVSVRLKLDLLPHAYENLPVKEIIHFDLDSESDVLMGLT
jgi:hypothetical protein